MPTIVLDLDSSGAVKGLSNYDSAVDRSSAKTDSGIGKMRTGLNNFGMVAAAAAGTAALAIGAFAKHALMAASDLQEVQGKFDVVFDGMTDTAEGWSTELVNSYGQSITKSKEFLSSTQDLLVPMGMAQGAAGEMSFEVAKLATDLGSFNNIDSATVMNDMQSALVGNYETMKKYGVVLNATAIEQKIMADNVGLSKDAITQAMKAQATYDLILAGSAAAVGDFSRTQDSFANQMVVFKSTLENITVQLGTYLIPYATQFITALNKWAKDQGNVNKVINFTVKAVQFLYNGFKGLGLLADAVIVGIAKGFEYLIKVTVAFLKPLDMALDALVALGTIDSNPLQDLVTLVEDFANSAVIGFTETLTEIEKTNEAFDALSGKIMGAKNSTDALKVASDGLKDTAVPAAAEIAEKMAEIKRQTDAAAAAAAGKLNPALDGLVPPIKESDEEIKKVKIDIDSAAASADRLRYNFDSSTASANNLAAATNRVASAAKSAASASASSSGGSSGGRFAGTQSMTVSTPSVKRPVGMTDLEYRTYLAEKPSAYEQITDTVPDGYRYKDMWEYMEEGPMKEIAKKEAEMYEAQRKNREKEERDRANRSSSYYFPYSSGGLPNYDVQQRSTEMEFLKWLDDYLKQYGVTSIEDLEGMTIEEEQGGISELSTPSTNVYINQSLSNSDIVNILDETHRIEVRA